MVREVPETKETLSAKKALQLQFKDLSKNSAEWCSVGIPDEDNFFVWEVVLFGPQETLYEGGVYKARLTFPNNYPYSPPTMKFLTEMWHPNIYPNGDVCISILHPPGEDQYGYEDAGERWMPVHSVESILISVLSLLSSDTPNLDSPANLDAAKEVRESLDDYRRKVRKMARESVENPDNFI